MNKSSDQFLSTKIQILKQKYEYMRMYKTETQRRLTTLRDQNQVLRQKIAILQKTKKQQNDHLDEWGEMQEKFREEEKQKLRNIEELTKLIGQYKFLCQEAIRNSKISHGCSMNQSILGNHSFRENSRLNILDRSENMNKSNTSMSRNKSYKKVKTHLYCDLCERQYQPNKFYQHLEQCRAQQCSSRVIKQTRRTDGYRSLRQ